MSALLARDILFPEGPSWGALYVREEGAGYDEPWWVSMPSKVLVPGLAPRDRFLDWERIGDARGRHTAAMNAQLGYRAALELPGQLGDLGSLEADAFWSMDLSYCSVGDDQLPGILSKSMGARCLDLSFTFITGDKLGDVCKLEKLQALHLAFTKLANPILVEFGSLGELEVLNLMGAGIALPNTTHLPALSSLTSLESLDLSFNPITDQDLETFTNLEGLRVLSLVNTDISDEGLHVLMGMNSLRRLHLGRNQITDHGVSLIADMKGLRCLSLSGPGITDASVVNLAEMAELQKLFLRGTAITEKGAKAIAANIPDCEIDHGSGKDVRSKDYTGTRITDMIYKDLMGE
jgi:hypothetical protein